MKLLEGLCRWESRKNPNKRLEAAAALLKFYPMKQVRLLCRTP